MAFAMTASNNAANASGDVMNVLPNGMKMLRDTTGKYALEHDLVVKAILVGDSGVGKSSVLMRFTHGDFSHHFVSTVGVDYANCTFDRQGKIVRMQLWDTAGQDRFKTISRTFYRGVHGCALVFAVDDAESFEHVSEWAKEVTQFGSADTPFVLIGNKADTPAALRQVAPEAAQMLAQKLGCEYVETSAKADTNISAAFAKLAEACIDRKMKQFGNGQHPMRSNNKRVQLNGDGANSNGTNEPSTKCAC
jgi:small GTP-binding protein